MKQLRLFKTMLLMCLLLSGISNAWGEVTYTKVTDASTLKTGDVLILACDTKSKYAGGFSGDYLTAVDDQSSAMRITLKGNSGSCNLLTPDGNYIGASAVKKLSETSGTRTWTITISNGDAEITSTTNAYGSIKYNASSPRFLNYSSGQTPIQIYKVTDNSTPPSPVYTINIDNNIVGGSISAPTSASAGSTINLSATPNTGYEFTSWNVTGATVASATNATTTFTMPAANVNVSATFTAVQGGETGDGGEYVWTNLEDINPNDEVIITMTNANGTYAMSNKNGTTAAPTATLVTVSNNSISSPGIEYIWNINYSEGKLTAYINVSSEKWLYCTATNNGVRVGNNSSKTFVVEGTYLKHEGTSRYVGVYNDADFRCYTTNTGSSNIANQTLAFYVKKGAPTIPAPIFDVAAGIYPEEQLVLVDNYDDNYMYFYTTDGSDPDCDEELDAVGTALEYDNEKGITISTTTTLKMIAVDVDSNKSEITSAEYVIPLVFTSLEELVAADVESGTIVTVSFENVSIKSFYQTGNYRNGVYFDIQKNENDIMIYYRDVPEEWLEKGTLSGTITSPWKEYNGTWELAPAYGTWDWYNLTYTAPDMGQFSYSLEIQGNGTVEFKDKNGTVIAPGQLVDYNTVLTPTFTPEDGWKFSKWEYFTTFDYWSTPQTGNFTITKDVQFRVTFVPLEYYTINWSVNGEIIKTDENVLEGTDLAAPTDPVSELSFFTDYEFKGWVTDPSKVLPNTVPVFANTDKAVASTTYYAVFAEKVGDGADKWVRQTTVPADDNGEYLIVKETSEDALNVNAMKAATSSNRFDNGNVRVEGNVVIAAPDSEGLFPDASLIWKISKDGEYYSLYNESTGKYAGGTNTKNQGALLDDADTDLAKWSISYTGGTFEVINYGRSQANSDSGNKYLRNNKTYGWAIYAQDSGDAPVFYKKIPGYTDFTVCPPLVLDEMTENITENKEADGHFNRVKVIRKVWKNEWNTICLPFDMTEEQIKENFGNSTKVMSLDGLAVEENCYYMLGSPVKSMNKATPYLLYLGDEINENVLRFEVKDVDVCYKNDVTIRKEVMADNGKTLIYHGTYVRTTVPPNHDYWVVNVYYYRVGSPNPNYSGIPLSGFRGYFESPNPVPSPVLVGMPIEIELKDPPINTIYDDGEYFEPSGLVISAKYQYADDNKIIHDVIGDFSYSKYAPYFSFVPGLDTPLTGDNDKVTITFGGASTDLDITVGASEIHSATFIFNTDEGLAALGIAKPASSAGTDLGSDSYTSGPISMTATDGSTHTRVWNNNGNTDLRVYNGGSLTFAGALITKVVFDGTISKLSVNGESVTNNTWEGNNTSVRFDVGATENIKTITVYYTDATLYDISVSEVSHGEIEADRTQAVEGEIVALTATPDDGYVFSAWDVKDTAGNTITVTDDTFTMPASNVTVSASFIEGEPGELTYGLFVKVSSQDDIFDGGQYIIVREKGEENGNVAAIKNQDPEKFYLPTSEPFYTNGYYEGDVNKDGMPVVVTVEDKGVRGFTLTNNGLYLTGKSNSTNLTWAETATNPSYWTLTLNSQKNVAIVNKSAKSGNTEDSPNREIRFNTGTPDRFADYSSSTGNVVTLYRYVDYLRTGLTPDKYGTICLPRKAVIGGVTLYNVAGTVENGIAIEENEDNVMEAGKPYIFKAEAEKLVATYVGKDVFQGEPKALGLVGNLGEDKLPVPAYCYVLSNNQLRMVEEGGKASIGQYKAYIDLDGVSRFEESTASSKVVVLESDTPTGITDVGDVSNLSKVYNLQGQRVNTPSKGVYIKNGRKFIVK